MFGLVVSPGYIPPSPEVEYLKPAFLRSILYHVRDCDAVAARRVPYMVTVNNECEEVQGWANWEGAIQQIADRPLPPFAVCVGNEFDLFWQHNRSDVPPEFAADLVRRASRILRPRGIRTVATSVASALWPEYLRRMADLCRDEADWFDIHPYGQRPDGWGSPGWMHGELRQTLELAYAQAGKPVICSEIGVKVGDAGGEDQVAWWMRAAAQTCWNLGLTNFPAQAWFAWRDEIGAPHERGPHAFGLRREDSSARPAHAMFRTLPQSHLEVIPVFTVGAGVLEKMALHNDTPATDEIYHPIGSPQSQYSETFGKSGRRYVYIFSTNTTVIYEPQGEPDHHPQAAGRTRPSSTTTRRANPTVIYEPQG